ncbi:hypothetical protein [Actibacterium lipolyticum]|uniref:Uncharacterized protein n=1 Tax=Actibacterium lipolyticum TaxID=1524263 RepID=A0A238JL46_9RHOB|nr:hypothetical protein [Actibacterium lipolyticum]SMX31361.1 hypothetical protein COL8621_00408 [Actibacterium lipolyticum]
MKAVTGVIVDLEGSNQQIDKRDDGQLGYLEDNIEGAGVLQELADNRGTLKAKLRTPDNEVAQVSVPSANFMKHGDVVTVVKDNDGCEFYYENRTSDRTWGFSRCPADKRRLTKFARAGINWGLFGGLLVGLLASLGRGQSVGLNLTAGAFIVIAITSMIWSLTGRPRAARRHLAAAKDLARGHKSTHEYSLMRKRRQFCWAVGSALLDNNDYVGYLRAVFFSAHRRSRAVRDQVFWNQRRRSLRESLAHQCRRKNSKRGYCHDTT